MECVCELVALVRFLGISYRVSITFSIGRPDSDRQNGIVQLPRSFATILYSLSKTYVPPNSRNRVEQKRVSYGLTEPLSPRALAGD